MNDEGFDVTRVGVRGGGEHDVYLVYNTTKGCHGAYFSEVEIMFVLVYASESTLKSQRPRVSTTTQENETENRPRSTERSYAAT